MNMNHEITTKRNTGRTSRLIIRAIRALIDGEVVEVYTLAPDTLRISSRIHQEIHNRGLKQIECPTSPYGMFHCRRDQHIVGTLRVRPFAGVSPQFSFREKSASGLPRDAVYLIDHAVLEHSPEFLAMMEFWTMFDAPRSPLSEESMPHELIAPKPSAEPQTDSADPRVESGRSVPDGIRQSEDASHHVRDGSRHTHPRTNDDR